MIQVAIILFFSFLLDQLLGDPRYPLHPARLIGHLISTTEDMLRKIGLAHKIGGLVLLAFTESVVVGTVVVVWLGLGQISLWAQLIWSVFVCYSCMALKDLINHVRPIVVFLESGELEKARQAVGLVVGRDVSQLSEKDVCRAAIETLAENFVDGFLSPLFWFVVGGTLGWSFGFPSLLLAIGFMAGFKGISTLDSIVGYKDQRYKRLGWASAKADDLLNFIPARLSGVILFLGALVVRADAVAGLRAFVRERLKHDSPNAAHGESFVAGALGICLGGPTRYAYGLKKKPWLGQGFPDPTPTYITKALSLIHSSGWITIILAAGVVLLMA